MNDQLTKILEIENDPMFKRIFLESLNKVPIWYRIVYRFRMFFGI
jgi:hypothetical protein